MRASTVGILCSAALIACFVNRPSEDLACSTNADCANLPGRQCQGGYCIVPNCPSDCTSCDEAARTCQVDCTDPADCDDAITCPSGWHCTINCNAGGACHNISCTSGSTCNIACNAANACDAISCQSACQCDLTCAQGNCASFSCPVRGNGANQVRCTQDGTTSTPCDSSRATSCTSC